QVALNAGVSPEKALDAVNQFSRDNARTPFQWDGSAHAGFTDGTPWLSVNPNYPRVNLAAQRTDPDSVWNFYRALTALRSDPAWRDTVVYGRTIPYRRNQKNLMAYYRHGERTLLVMGNFQGHPQHVPLPKQAGAVLLNNLPGLDVRNGVLYAAPWQFVVMEINRR
ncbi:MAG: glucohydrolase, partial [Oscillibacter sp.]|nr:glucohydrolase [Oscillibacter sp.]